MAAATTNMVPQNGLQTTLAPLLHRRPYLVDVLQEALLLDLGVCEDKCDRLALEASNLQHTGESCVARSTASGIDTVGSEQKGGGGLHQSKGADMGGQHVQGVRGLRTLYSCLISSNRLVTL